MEVARVGLNNIYAAHGRSHPGQPKHMVGCLTMEMIMNRCCSAVVFVLAATFVAQTQSVSSRDKTAIKAQLAAYSEARQRGDGRAQAAFYTEDAEIWRLTTRKMSRGHAAIETELNLPSDPTAASGSKTRTSTSSTRRSLSLTPSTTAPRWTLMVMTSRSWSNARVSGS